MVECEDFLRRISMLLLPIQYDPIITHLIVTDLTGMMSTDIKRKEDPRDFPLTGTASPGSMVVKNHGYCIRLQL